jgi:hypothetical protein
MSRKQRKKHKAINKQKEEYKQLKAIGFNEAKTHYRQNNIILNKDNSKRISPNVSKDTYRKHGKNWSNDSIATKGGVYKWRKWSQKTKYDIILKRISENLV